jgi:hypothetical protein
MKTFLFAFVAMLTLSGCATAPFTPTPGATPLQAIGQFTVADLQAADADAVANGDTIAHMCYPVMETFIMSITGSTGSTTVSGAVSAFQKARDLANKVASGVPQALKIACAPLLVDDTTLLAKIAALGVTVH